MNLPLDSLSSGISPGAGSFWITKNTLLPRLESPLLRSLCKEDVLSRVGFGEEQGQRVRDGQDAGGDAAYGFAIGLDVDAGVFGRGDLGLSRPADGDAGGGVEALRDDGTEEAQVIVPGTVLKDDDFEVRVCEADPFGDFEIASVVAYSRD